MSSFNALTEAIGEFSITIEVAANGTIAILDVDHWDEMRAYVGTDTLTAIASVLNDIPAIIAYHDSQTEVPITQTEEA